MTCVKQWAKMEPLVDYVPVKGIITDHCPVLDIDLQKCTIADLDFASQFSLTSRRNEYIHALTGWFETYFSHGRQKIVLSTSIIFY